MESTGLSTSNLKYKLHASIDHQIASGLIANTQPTVYGLDQQHLANSAYRHKRLINNDFQMVRIIINSNPLTF